MGTAGGVFSSLGLHPAGAWAGGRHGLSRGDGPCPRSSVRSLALTASHCTA